MIPKMQQAAELLNELTETEKAQVAIFIAGMQAEKKAHEEKNDAGLDETNVRRGTSHRISVITK